MRRPPESLRARRETHAFPRRPRRRAERAIQPGAFQIAHSHGAIGHFLENHLRGQSVRFDPQVASLRDFENALPRTGALMVSRHQRRVAQSLRRFLSPRASRWDRAGFRAGLRRAPAVAPMSSKACRAGFDESFQPGLYRRAPPPESPFPSAANHANHVSTGSARLAPVPGRAAGGGNSPAFEVTAHVVRVPRIVAGQRGDRVPVLIVRIDHDHRVVSGAAAERAGPRIENAILRRDELRRPSAAARYR